MEIDYNIVKRNDIVQRASYSLSATEQKLLLYIISKIKPEDIDFKRYCFRVVDLMGILGLQDSGKNRDIIRDSLRNLRKKEVHIKTETEDIYTGWIESPSFTRGYNQIVTVRIDEKLKPFLLELSEWFTIYQLRQIMTMRSRYSIRLYEICKSHLTKNYFTAEVEELKKQLDTKYPWKDLKTKILDVAKEEINTKSDLLIDYTPIRTGRKYTAIRFKVIQKNRAEALRTQAREESKLYGYDK